MTNPQIPPARNPSPPRTYRDLIDEVLRPIERLSIDPKPVPTPPSEYEVRLRDDFAKIVLAALLADKSVVLGHESLACICFDIADSMMDVRGRA